MHKIRFGGHLGDYLELTILGWEHPGTEGDDASWIVCNVEVSVGRFLGRASGSLQIHDVTTLLHQLRIAHEKLAGSARLMALESWFEVQFFAANSGQFHVSGFLCDDVATGNTLNFIMQSDQSFIRPAIEQLRNACRLLQHEP